MKQEISNVIKAARITKGISVPELAEMIGVKRQSVYRYESGEGVPPKHRLATICDILDLDMKKCLQLLDLPTEDKVLKNEK